MEPQTYAFGRFRMDVASRQLLRDGTHVPLAAKAFDTLLLLVRHRDRAVTKDELMKAVWPDTFVSDDSLTQSISSLRRTFGDAEIIATIPRRGYRFIVPVVEDPPPDWDALRELAAAGIRDPGPGTRDPEPAVRSVAERAAEPSPQMPEFGSRIPDPGSRRASHRRRWLAIAGVLAAVAAALLIGRTLGERGTTAAPPLLRFTQEAPPGTAILSGGVLSPDGRLLAFVAEDVEAGTTKLWVRPLDSPDARALQGTESAVRPFWSPDSQSLGFIANNRLKTVAVSGGTPRNLAGVRNFVGGAAWGDGVIVFANWRAGLDGVAPTGGAVRSVTSLDASAAETTHQWPQFLPGGRRFVFSVASAKPERAGIYVGSIDEGEHVRVLDGSHAAAAYAPPGYLVFIRDNTLMAQRFDAETLALQGTPVTIADRVSPPTIRNSATISAAQGGLVAFGGGTNPRRLAWFNRRGERLGTIDAPATLTNPTFSPDEKQLLAVSFDPDSQGVWLLDLERGAPNRLIPDATMPMPGPDGDVIAFGSNRGAGVFDMYLRRIGGRNEDEPLLRSDESKFVNDWSRDGRYILYGSSNAKTGEDLWVLPTSGDRTPIPYLRTQYNETQSRLSPDGRWVAYASDESGMLEVYVQSFPVPGAKQIVSIRGGAQPLWRRDGRELYYLAADRTLMVVDVSAAGDTLRVSRPRPLFRPPVSGPLNVYRSHYAVTADGQRFVIDAVDAATTQESITVLANWPALLAR